MGKNTIECVGVNERCFKAWMTYHNYSMEDIADSMHIARQTLSRWLRVGKLPYTAYYALLYLYGKPSFEFILFNVPIFYKL